jgi:hypothetical protein
MPANRITRLGIARTFQNIRLFKEMTVLDNVMIGRHFKTDLFSLKKRRFLNAMAGLINQKAEEKAISTDALEYLSFFHMRNFLGPGEKPPLREAGNSRSPAPSPPSPTPVSGRAGRRHESERD